MFRRSRVLIRSYTTTEQFERAVSHLARRGYEVADINGRPSAQAYDRLTGRYLAHSVPISGEDVGSGELLVVYTRSSKRRRHAPQLA